VAAAYIEPEARPNGPRYGNAYNSVTGARIVGSAHTLKAVYASPVHTESFPVNAQGSYRSNRPAPQPNRLFAGPDGHVYRREDNGTWHDAASTRAPADPRVLDRDYHAREVGALRSQGFRTMNQAPAAPAPAPRPGPNDNSGREQR